MAIYDRFAPLYARGPHTAYSARMAALFPSVLARFAAQPQTLLDVACGEGTFAVAMAKQGFKVTGVDRSPQMLRHAREQALREGVEVDFILQDMRSLAFDAAFDVATCWYDSLNYLLAAADLEGAFAGVRRALKPGGLFVFDMNTIYGLAVLWQRYPAHINEDTPESFEVQRASYDFETNIATAHITGFLREGGMWSRLDEEHHERGYSLSEIRQCLQSAGLRELACWDSPQAMSEPKPDSGKVWFVVQR